MLVIRKAQLRALKKAAEMGFENKMVAHLNQFFPVVFAKMEEAEMLEMIRYGIQRARHHGFESGRDICKYIDVMVVFGPDFDKDADLPWAAEILSDNTTTDNKVRINLLITSAIAQADNQEGLHAQ